MPRTRGDDHKRKQRTTIPALMNFIYHLHPGRLPKETMRFTHTWGLGGMAALLFVLQAVTGLLLRFKYVPQPAYAYDSILTIQNNVLFGQFVRNIHYWSGTFLLIIVFLHLLRTFLTRAYRPPRHLNWLLGIGLLVSVIFSYFTGYLLPWDQLSYWAITVSTNMLNYVPVGGAWLVEFVRGGKEVGAQTLLTFYTFHTGVLPVTIIVLMVYHFWRVRRAGGVVLPGNAENGTPVDAVPHLVSIEIATGLVLIAAVLLISVFFDAPLLDPANPVASPNPARAPWYFAGIQELEIHFHPVFGVFVIPLLLVSALIFIPFYPSDSESSGIWFYSQKGKKLALVTAIFAVLATFVIVLIDDHFAKDILLKSGLPAIISNGLLPFLAVALGLVLYAYFIRRRFQASKNELLLTLFVFVTSSFAVLTLVNLFLRGEGMRLIF